MKKSTGSILLLMLLLCIATVGILFFLLMRKNNEADELESDLRRSKRDLEEYEEQLADQADAFEKEKQELSDSNESLKKEKKSVEEELEETKAQLEEQAAHIPETGNVVINEGTPRVYQQGQYQEFCAPNDTYDTWQYKFSMIYNYPTDVVFAGDSLIERCSWDEMYPDLEVKNRGIGGDSINGLRVRIETIMQTKPKKVFIYIGINDILQGREVENIIGRYNELFDELSHYDCKYYVQAILPVASSQSDAERICLDVNEINERLRSICEGRGYTFIDLWSEFAGDDWALKDEYYYDGVHVNAAAYKRWKEIIDPYVYE